MNSQELLNTIETWVKSNNFSAPYGVLTNNRLTKNGRKYLCINFGRARTLDVTVEIFNINFVIVRTSRHGKQVFKDKESLFEFLYTL